MKQEASKAEALREIVVGRRLLASRRRLQSSLGTLCAAWSPWAAGLRADGAIEPRGWEISSHKDELMRQVRFLLNDVQCITYLRLRVLFSHTDVHLD